MKLLFVITDLGSFNNFLIELALSFSENTENELHVICSKEKVINVEGKNYSFKQNLFFHFVDIPRGFSFIKLINAAHKIRKIINRVNPDLVHIHFTTSVFPTLIFKSSKVTYWSTFHGLGMNSTSGLKRLVFSIVEMFCFIKSDKIFVLNSVDFNLVDSFSFLKSKVVKLKSLGVGCNIEKFDPIKSRQAFIKNFQNTHSIFDSHTIITYTGRFVSFKGFDLVIRIFKNLVKTYPNKYKLLLIGGEDQIHPTGLTPDENMFLETSPDIINVGFISEVQNYLAITDLFVFPSKKEGLPVCILESLAMGVPVVSFNTKGSNEIVANDYNGKLIMPISNTCLEVNEFVKQIDIIVNDKSLYNQLKLNALKDRLMYSRNNFINDCLREYMIFQEQH